MIQKITNERKVVLKEIYNSIKANNTELTIDELSNKIDIEYDIVYSIIGDLVANGIVLLDSRGIIQLSREGLDRFESEIINNNDYEYAYLLNRVFSAQKKIEEGFLDLAESINEIHKKKLYKIYYNTFEEFCEIELGYSRQTLYIYFSILNLIQHYPKEFPRDRAIKFGQKKMKAITQAANKIDKTYHDKKDREKIKKKMFKDLNPSMPARKIESKIKSILKG